jgi:hypothetical protein
MDKMKRVVVDLDSTMAVKLEQIRHTLISRNIDRPFEEKPEAATYKAIVERGLETVYREVVGEAA